MSKDRIVIDWRGDFVDERFETARWASARLYVVLVQSWARPVVVWLSRKLADRRVMSYEAAPAIPVGNLKMARETFCLAQHALATLYPDAERHSTRLQRIIDQIDVHRPLGPDGKHGNRHTATCGCEDVSVVSPREGTEK